MIKFRELKAEEIEVRAAQCFETGAKLLLYKDARCDMNILDETVGVLNWQRHHSRNNANCVVSIWDDEKVQWIEKEDTGTESNTEAAKGLASDSFKRACTNFGIGRSLYSAPSIFVRVKCELNKSGRGYQLPRGIQYKVTDYITENGKIVGLRLVDQDNREVFRWGTLDTHKKESFNIVSTGTPKTPKPVVKEQELPIMFNEDGGSVDTEINTDIDFGPVPEKTYTEDEKQHMAKITNVRMGKTKNDLPYVSITYTYEETGKEEEQFQPIHKQVGIDSIAKTLRDLKVASAEDEEKIKKFDLNALQTAVRKLNNMDSCVYVDVNTNKRGYKEFSVRPL